jgi:hypothetical protein
MAFLHLPPGTSRARQLRFESRQDDGDAGQLDLTSLA